MALQKLSTSRRLVWLTHGFILVFFFLLPLLLNRDGMARPGLPPMPPPSLWWLPGLCMQLSMTFLFYFNAYWLVPQFLNQQYWRWYLLAIVATVALLVLLGRIIEPAMMQGVHAFPGPKPILFSTFPYLLVVPTSIAFRVVQDNFTYRQRIMEVETEKLQAELTFLRSQINPHFLFNTLNNFVALARKNSDLLEPSIIKLAGLMHYMLYESDETLIDGEKELEYIRNYIELQRLRFGPSALISFVVALENESFEIAPMLLIPFVENAIKHGNGLNQKPHVEIHFTIVGNRLNFTVANAISLPSIDDHRGSGIGLSNVRRRLELLYPDRHRLVCLQEQDQFHVQLEIMLS